MARIFSPSYHITHIYSPSYHITCIFTPSYHIARIFSPSYHITRIFSPSYHVCTYSQNMNTCYDVYYSCWLSTGSGFIWAFIGPVCAVILINMCIMIVVIRIVVKSAKAMSMTSSQHHSVSLVK